MNDFTGFPEIFLNRESQAIPGPVLPWAYTPRVFGFMIYDIVIGLGPPHRLGGALTSGLLEPVYVGAATPGAKACVIVPGRRLAEAVGGLDVLFGHPSTTELTLRTR